MLADMARFGLLAVGKILPELLLAMENDDCTFDKNSDALRTLGDGKACGDGPGGAGLSLLGTSTREGIYINSIGILLFEKLPFPEVWTSEASDLLLRPPLTPSGSLRYNAVNNFTTNIYE